MSRMSAKFFARELVGYSTADVYDIWKDMGLVFKNTFGDWSLTELGRSVGGKLSKNPYRPTLTFDFDKVFPMMEAFYLKVKGPN